MSLESENREEIKILDHVIATVYTRQGRLWMSQNGEEKAIMDYRRSDTQPVFWVTKRGQWYSTVEHADAEAPPTEEDVMKRTSQSVSILATQITRIKDLLRDDLPEKADAYGQLLSTALEGAIEALHYTSSEILLLRSECRHAQLAHEDYQTVANNTKQELDAVRMKQARTEAILNRVLALEPSCTSLNMACLLGYNQVIPQILSNKVKCNEWVKFEKETIFGPVSTFTQMYEDLETYFTPIHIAALKGNVTVMDQLFQADPELAKARTYDKRWTMLDCASHGSLDALKLVLSWHRKNLVTPPSHIQHLLHGANPSLPTPSELITSTSLPSIIRLACFGDRLDVIQYVLGQQSPYLSELIWNDLKSTYFNYMVFWCAYGGGLNTLKWLLGTDDTIKQRAKFIWARNQSFRLAIAAENHPALFAWLCSKNVLFPHALLGAPFQAQDRIDLEKNRFPHLNRLILAYENCFNLGAVDFDGHNIITYACAVQSEPILEWVSQHIPADQFEALSCLPNGTHAVHYAARGGLHCLRWFCNNLESFRQKTPSKLLSLATSDHKTVVHFAAEAGELSVLQWLRSEHDAKMDIFDNFGDQPIHYCHDSVNIVKWLHEECKCDLRSHNHSGKALVHTASPPVLNYIISKVDRTCLNAQDNDGDTPAHYAAARNDTITLQWLMENGASLVLRNAQSETPRARAVLVGAVDTIKWLSANGITA